jgi:long-chain acyl-CoA synthetase
VNYFNLLRDYVRAEKIESKHALYFKGRAYSYKDILLQGDLVANMLTGLGVTKGDPVAIVLPNMPEFISIFLGINKIGGIAVPVNVLLTKYEIKPILAQTEAKILFVGKELLAAVEEIKKESRFIQKAILVSHERVSGTTNIYDLLKETKPAFIEGDGEMEDVAVIFFTAGTTGTPKGVMLTNNNLFYVVEGQRDRLLGLGEMVSLVGVPLSHIFGLNTITFCNLFRKSPVVILDRYVPEEAAREIANCRVSYISGVPLMIYSLFPFVEKYDLSCISLVASGATMVPEDLYYKVEQILHATMVEGWGLTEGCGNTTMTPVGIKKIGSCGIPYKGTELRIVDPQGKSLPPGQVGELVQKSPANMKGYLNNLEATKEILKDGWLNTGDLARMDEEGYVYIVDRLKDLIIRGGYNVYPG